MVDMGYITEDRGINRNIVECKFVIFSFYNISSKNELIETLWNVNRADCRGCSEGRGINRNIVECKFNQRRS